MSEQKPRYFWNEKWMPIPFDVESPPRYDISNYGRIRSFQSAKGETNEAKLIKGSVIQGYMRSGYAGDISPGRYCRPGSGTRFFPEYRVKPYGQQCRRYFKIRSILNK